MCNIGLVYLFLQYIFYCYTCVLCTLPEYSLRLRFVGDNFWFDFLFMACASTKASSVITAFPLCPSLLFLKSCRMKLPTNHAIRQHQAFHFGNKFSCMQSILSKANLVYFHCDLCCFLLLAGFVGDLWLSNFLCLDLWSLFCWNETHTSPFLQRYYLWDWCTCGAQIYLSDYWNEIASSLK